MSDASTPQTPRAQPQPQPQAQPRPVRAEIERLPETVRNSTGAQRMRGEIQGTRDGITRIRTNEGEIRVRLPEGQRPAQGRTVEIEIPGSESARRQAIIRTRAQQAQIESGAIRQRQPLPEPTRREQVTRSDSTRTAGVQSKSRPEGERIQLSRELAQSLSRARKATLGSEAQNITRGQPVRLIALDSNQSAQFLRQLPQPVQIRLTTAQLAALIDAQPTQAQNTTPNDAVLQTQAATSRVVPRISALIAALQANASQGTGNTASTNAQTTQPDTLLTTALQQSSQQARQRITTTQLNFTVARPDAQNLLQDGIGRTLHLNADKSVQDALTTSRSAAFRAPGTPTTPQLGTNQFGNQFDARFLNLQNVDLTLKTAGNQTITSLNAGVQTGSTTPVLQSRIASNAASRIINSQIAANTNFIPQSGALMGQVIGQTQQGLPVLQLNLPGTANTQQLYTLQFSAGNLTTGDQAGFTSPSAGGTSISGQKSAQLSIQIGAQTSMLGLSTGQLISLPAGTGTQALFSGAFDPIAGMTLSSDLGDAIQTLQASGNARMAQNLQAMIPNAANSQQLGPAALLFVAAARGGDLSNWLGSNSIEMLRRAGRGDLANRLTGASAGSTGTGNTIDSGGGEWRSMQMPIAWQEEIHAARLYYRQSGHDDRQDNQEEKDTQTRFIFDLTLSRMGAVQLDGLFKEKKLDLVVRTQQRLSSAMRQHIRYNYTHALEASGLHGEVRFQNAPGSWVMFQDDNDKKTLKDAAY